ncbi:hypothetical protein [Catenulispora yoronensis]
MNQNTFQAGSVLDRAATFLWGSGRVLEQRWFAALFGGPGGSGGTGGTAASYGAGLIAALAAYRNDDGGFAYGVEPDIRGPESEPLAVATALKIMADAGPLDPATVTPTLDWIESITAADGGVPAVLPSLAKYPHAPFMPIDAEPTGSLLATGQLLGPLLRAGIAEHPWVKGAMEFTRREVEALGQTHPYDVDAAVMFLDAAPDQGWARQQAERIGALVREQRIVLLDPARPQDAVIAPGYAPGEHHLPHDYAKTPDSLARAWFSDEEMERSLDYLLATQDDDGGWPMNWVKWSPTVEFEARPAVTVRALRTLRAYGRI